MFKSRFPGERRVLEGKGIPRFFMPIRSTIKSFLWTLALGPIVSEIGFLLENFPSLSKQVKKSTKIVIPIDRESSESYFWHMFWVEFLFSILLSRSGMGNFGNFAVKTVELAGSRGNLFESPGQDWKFLFSLFFRGQDWKILGISLSGLLN